MIEIKNLKKTYGNHVAVNDISFTVQKGEVLGFLGPNGAGKTTTMNVLTGYIPPTSGMVKVCGYDVSEDIMEVKKRIGYLPETPPLYPEMTVKEYLYFVAEVKGVAKTLKTEQVVHALEVVGLTNVQNRLIKNLSKGYKQRVGLAQALIGDPDVLIFDEPTVGLDPQQIIDIRELIKELAKKHTIILSSHILPEVSAVCSRIVVINKGEIVTVAETKDLLNYHQGNTCMQLEVEGSIDTVRTILEPFEGIKDISFTEKNEQIGVFLSCDSANDIRKQLFFAFAKERIPILEMTVQKRTLEDIFLDLINDDASMVALQETADEQEI